MIATYKPAATMHFAAFACVGDSVSDPGKYYRNNVAGSLTLLEAARDHSIDQFIFSSTCPTYGVPDHLRGRAVLLVARLWQNAVCDLLPNSILGVTDKP